MGSRWDHHQHWDTTAFACAGGREGWINQVRSFGIFLLNLGSNVQTQTNGSRADHHSTLDTSDLLGTGYVNPQVVSCSGAFSCSTAGVEIAIEKGSQAQEKFMDWKWWGMNFLFMLGGAVVGFLVTGLTTGTFHHQWKNRKKLKKYEVKAMDEFVATMGTLFAVIGVVGFLACIIQHINFNKKMQRKRQLEAEIDAMFAAGYEYFFRHYDEYIEKVNEWHILTFGYPKYVRADGHEQKETA